MATYQELRTRSQQVRDEQNIGGNTALRVGQLLMDIVKYFYDSDAAAGEYLQQHFAMVNDGTQLLNWHQSPIVILHTMGETYDEGDFSALSQGENYYHAGFVMEANGHGGGINGETPKVNVLYVNLANDTLYTWNGSSFDAITSGGGGGSISGDDIIKNAYYSNGNLVLVFETESGDKTVTIPVTFDASNYVPTSRTVNGKALSNNITLSQSDIPGLVAALAGKISGIKTSDNTPLTPDSNGVVTLPPAGSTISPASNAPSMDGNTAAIGVSDKYAREDHVHPHDTTKQDTLTFDDVPTAGSNNAVKSGGVKRAIDEKLSNVTVNAIPANSVTLQATESNGVLSIFFADNTPILQLSDTELSIGASGGDFTLNGLYLQNDIEMAVTGDFSLSGTNVVEANGLYKILAANANGSNTVHVTYSGSSGSASGSIAITCGTISLSVSSISYSSLPSNYTLCDYIESTSTSDSSNYIDTNVPISSEIRVVAKIQNSKPNVIRFLYGARVYDGATILARVEGQSGSQNGTDVKNQRLIVHGSTFDESYLTDSASVHEFDVNKSRIIYDGQTYPASVVASNWSRPAIKMVICGYKEATENNSNYKAAKSCILAKYYYFKIYDGDTLVRDYIPAKDNTTGKYGLYDLVNNTFSTSAGSVEFTGQVTT